MFTNQNKSSSPVFTNDTKSVLSTAGFGVSKFGTGKFGESGEAWTKESKNSTTFTNATRN